MSTVKIPGRVVEATLAWARELGGPAYDETEDWCQPIAELASYVEDDEDDSQERPHALGCVSKSAGVCGDTFCYTSARGDTSSRPS